MSSEVEGTWVPCRCGKDRLIEGEFVVAFGMCRSCEADFERQANVCPEVLRFVDGRVSVCRLSWAHVGRCEPHPALTPEQLAELRRATL